MYYILTVLAGIITSIMIVWNGELSDQYGVYPANVIIHIVGLISITFVMLIRRDRAFKKRMPLYLYLGGVIGVATTTFNNIAYGQISVSAILALCLFGQSVTSIITDQLGFMGMPKYPFHKSKIWGLLLVSAGIAYMITDFEIVAVLLSFLSGVNLVVSRTLNARLAENTSVVSSTFFNYVTGLFVSALVMVVARGYDVSTIQLPSNIHMLFGGMLGVVVIWLFNVVAVKISSFYMTLFLFIAQVFTGVLLDAIITGTFSLHNTIGGLLVAAGLVINLMLDKRNSS
ncbi:MAG: DMT family transporter [Lachnospiraceae bacterium]